MSTSPGNIWTRLILRSRSRCVSSLPGALDRPCSQLATPLDAYQNMKLIRASLAQLTIVVGAARVEVDKRLNISPMLSARRAMLAPSDTRVFSCFGEEA